MGGPGKEHRGDFDHQQKPKPSQQQQGEVGPAYGATAKGVSNNNSNADKLPAGVPFQWIGGTYSFWLRQSWVQSASDVYAAEGMLVAPSRMYELLSSLKQHGMLDWVTDDRLRKAASQIGMSLLSSDVSKMHLATNTFHVLGLPPGKSAAITRAGTGLDIVLSVPDIKEVDGATFVMAGHHILQLVRVVENFTGLTIQADMMKRLTEGEFRQTIKVGTTRITLTEAACHNLFGETKYQQWLRGGQQTTGKLEFSDDTSKSEPQAATDLSQEEIAYIRTWMKPFVNEDKLTGGTPFILSKQLLAKLRALDALPKDQRDKILAILLGAKAKAGPPAEAPPAYFEQSIDRAIFEHERQAAGFAERPKRENNAGRAPVFDIDLPAHLSQSNGLISAGETVAFNIVIDWPVASSLEQQDAYTWRAMTAQIDWKLARVGSKDGAVKRTTYIANGDGGKESFKLALAPGETQAIFELHAFVNHNFFLPKHLATQIVVKPEAERMKDVKQTAFAGMGTTLVNDEDHDFDTSGYNEAFGDRKYDHGGKTYGVLPADFKRRTPAERRHYIEAEIARNTLLLGYLKDPTAIASCQHFLRQLAEEKAAVDGDAKKGWQPFELRGTYLGRGNHVPDGELALQGAVRRAERSYTDDMGDTSTWEVVEVQIRDLSRKIGAASFRFDAEAATFDAALEKAFLALCKHYPPGRVAVLAEGFEAEGRTANGKTLGFDLDTGTAWKSTKGAVFENKYVSGAVNILGAIVMIAFPPSTAVMLPLLAVYNEVSNIDALMNELAAGTLTGGKLAVHAGQLMLDVVPFVGETAAIRGSALRMLTFKGATLGGMGLLMTTQVIGQIAAIRDGQIAQMAKGYEAYLALGAQTHESDPDLAGKRAALMAQLDTDGQALRDVSMQVWQDAVVNLAAVVIPVHLAQGVNMHLGLRRVNALTSAGRFQHAPGVEPHYNAELGMIVGDQGKLSLPMIDQLAGVQAQHWRTVGTQLGAELGLPTDAVRLRPGTATRAWLEGDIVHAEFAPGTAPAAAKATWKQQVAAEQAGGKSSKPLTVDAAVAPAAPGVAPKAAGVAEPAKHPATAAQDVADVRKADDGVDGVEPRPPAKVTIETADQIAARQIEVAKTNSMIAGLASSKALPEQHAHEQGSVPIKSVLKAVEEFDGISSTERAQQIDLLKQLIATGTGKGKKSMAVKDLSPQGRTVEGDVVSAPKQVVIASVEGELNVGLLNEMVAAKVSIEAAMAAGDATLLSESNKILKVAISKYREAIGMSKPDGSHYDATINPNAEFFARYKMIEGHGLTSAEIASKRASAAELGMQELRYSSSDKTAADVKADAEHLTANAPADSDVSLTYSTTKNRTHDERKAASEQGKAAEFARDWFEDPTLQKAFNGMDNAGVEHGDKGPALMWRAAAERTFRNAKQMSAHLQRELAAPGNTAAFADRYARLTGTDVATAEIALQRFRTTDYDSGLAATVERAKQLQAQDSASSAQRNSGTGDIGKWVPATPAIDAQGRISEQFAGLSLESVSSETRTMAEALRIWSAESGQQHGEVTMLGLTIHAGEQLLNPNITPFELFNQVDQAISMGADRIGHALIIGVEPDVLIAKGRLQPEQKAAFAARQREVTDRIRAKGVVVEANMSSNTEISNLTNNEHPAGTFVDEKLRVTVNTDDETVLNTTMKQELAKVAAAPGVQRADVAAMILEGYRSRMGNRELAQRGRIKPELQRALTQGLDASELNALSVSLAERFHIALAATPQQTIARVIDAAVGL